jgi:hypothetical protein
MNTSPLGPDALTLVIPLRAKEGMPLSDFYDYWLNAHVTMPPRFPGISSIWLHAVSFDSQTWPRLPGVSHRPEPKDEFHGVPEATFPTMDDLAAFQGASRVQMEDGINFLSQMIAYCSFGANTATIVDRTGDPAPDGHDTMVRHLLFLRRRPEVPVTELRSFVSDELAPAYAASLDVLKVRRHLFEEVEVARPRAWRCQTAGRQYQAALEVVADDASLTRLVSSPSGSGRRTPSQPAAKACMLHAWALHHHEVRGRHHPGGVRGVAVADVIKRVSANSQLEADVLGSVPPGTRASGSEFQPLVTHHSVGDHHDDHSPRQRVPRAPSMTLCAALVEELVPEFKGDLIGPDSVGYEKARAVWNAMIDKRPGLIARCTSTQDVVEVVKAAQRHGLHPSVRCGGHNVSGKALSEGGLTIDLGGMRNVVVDPENKVVHVDGGLPPRRRRRRDRAACADSARRDHVGDRRRPRGWLWVVVSAGSRASTG